MRKIRRRIPVRFSFITLVSLAVSVGTAVAAYS
jgi:hypothetical protein